MGCDFEIWPFGQRNLHHVAKCLDIGMEATYSFVCGLDRRLDRVCDARLFREARFGFPGDLLF